jgi:hypothetical protein
LSPPLTLLRENGGNGKETYPIIRLDIKLDFFPGQGSDSVPCQPASFHLLPTPLFQSVDLLDQHLVFFVELGARLCFVGSLVCGARGEGVSGMDQDGGGMGWDGVEGKIRA